MTTTSTNLIFSNISKEELNKLYLENKYYINNIAYKVLNETKVIVEYEDLKSEAALIFLNVVKKYDISFNTKFSTFLFNNIYYYLKIYIRDNYFESEFNHINYDINDMNLYYESNEINKIINEGKNEEIIDNIKKILSTKELKFVEKFLNDKDLKERLLNLFENKQIMKSIKHKVRLNKIEMID